MAAAESVAGLQPPNPSSRGLQASSRSRPVESAATLQPPPNDDAAGPPHTEPPAASNTPTSTPPKRNTKTPLARKESGDHGQRTAIILNLTVSTAPKPQPKTMSQTYFIDQSEQSEQSEESDDYGHYTENEPSEESEEYEYANYDEYDEFEQSQQSEQSEPLLMAAEPNQPKSKDSNRDATSTRVASRNDKYYAWAANSDQYDWAKGDDQYDWIKEDSKVDDGNKDRGGKK
ncbi:hypothetical protein QBC38DRAFT_505164 [Podospora fimiseda]|uniref:Uncharacterized protein n=1 Tax=Podospora fimiseda TaxID=252190 RepID=A0AAN6YMI1_9PEZI|nr:hypothetical protein QBC38DRAFT_505164 [Podospora fimiseda]